MENHRGTVDRNRGHVAAQRWLASKPVQVCSMNTFPSQRDCCFVSTSALFGLDTDITVVQVATFCATCADHVRATAQARRYVCLGGRPPGASFWRRVIGWVAANLPPFALAKTIDKRTSTRQTDLAQQHLSSQCALPGSLQYPAQLHEPMHIQEGSAADVGSLARTAVPALPGY